MRTLGICALLLGLLPSVSRAELYYLIVGGLGGDSSYAAKFTSAANSMARAAERTLGTTDGVIVLNGEEATLEALRTALADLSGNTGPGDRLAVFLIGHGSYDGTQYKFNLTGDDIDGAELAELIGSVPAQNKLIVNMTSASGSVFEDWSGDGRSVITATRSGAERNATRFAEHWAAALSSDDADLNKNGSVSAQEAYDYASRLVADSYEADGALATEHAQISGDAAGAFEVARLTERVALTPELDALNSRLSDLEEQVAALRLRREELGDDYLPQLQSLLVELASVQEQIDAAAED